MRKFSCFLVFIFFYINNNINYTFFLIVIQYKYHFIIMQHC